MFRSNFIFDSPCKVTKVIPEEVSHIGICAIDDIVAQSFAKNDAGWVRNEFAAALRAQTLEEYKNVIARMSATAVDLTKDKGIPDKLTLDQVIQIVRPRYCQSYTELQQYSDAISSLDFVQEMDADFVAQLNHESDDGDGEGDAVGVSD